MSKTQREAHLAQKFSDMEPSARATQIKVIGTYVDDMTSNDWRPKRSPISPKLNASLVQAVEDSLRDAGLRATYVFSRPSSKGGLRVLTASDLSVKGSSRDTLTDDEASRYFEILGKRLAGLATTQKFYVQMNEHGDGRGGSYGRTPTIVVTIKMV